MIKIVDIIIPCYNAEKTLPRALASIVSQTNPEKCMVTVVDDCSTQDIKSICDKFSSFIKLQYIRNEKNMKYPGLVRQVGIDHTNNQYIMFLDADDMLAPSAVQMAQTEMTRNEMDVLIGAFFSQTKEKTWNRMGQGDTTWLHGNVYRRSYLKEKGIKFCDRYNEDGSFNTMCYMLSDKVGYLNEPMYYWMHNEESITRSEGSFTVDHLEDVIETLIFAYQTIFKNKYNEKKVFRNMGEHCAFFHKMLDTTYTTKEGAAREAREEVFWKSLETFKKELDFEHFTPVQFQYFKYGFADGYVKFPKVGLETPSAMKVFKFLFPKGKMEIEDFNLAARQK